MKKVKSDTRAKPQHVNKVYTELLGLLDLTLEHRRTLNNRGLTEKEITTLGYRSLPLRKQELVASLIKKIDDVQGVPGFWKNGNKWDLAGKTGIVIPVRSRDGLINGLKIRVDKPVRASAKYILLSSNPGSEQGFPFGTKATSAIHWPLGPPRKITQLRITEGEMKADIATSLTDIYTISLPGVKMWRLALDALLQIKGLEHVLLSFDSDKDEPMPAGGNYGGDNGAEPEDDAETFLVGKACAELYMIIKENVKTSIEDWPKDAGKGIDDVILNGAQDRITLLQGEEAEAWAAEMLLWELPKGWVYASSVLQFIDTKTHQCFDTQQYNNWFRAEIKGNPAFKALSNPAFPKYHSLIYLPQQPQTIMRDGLKLFNIWRGNDKITEDRKTSCKPFLDHTAYMIPDERERNIFLDFLAWNVQKAGEKILWAMLLQSKEGVGKSYFGDILSMILGPHNVSKPSNDQIHEIYTGWAKNCSVVIIEELMSRGRLEMMNRLKPIITQADITIREMHTKHYDQPNVFNVLIFTNYEDALITKEDDRRYCVIYSQVEARDAEYYSKLWDWTRENIGAIYHLLKARDLSAFNPQARAPHTTWKEQMNYASMNPLGQWIREMIETEYWPFQSDIIATHHLHAKCLPQNLRNVSLKALGDALRSCGCKLYPSKTGQIDLGHGRRIRLWSVRRHEIWQSAEAATWVAEYEKWSNSSEPGNPLWDSRPI